MDGGTVVMAAESAVTRVPDAKLRILFLHPKTLIDSWPIPVDTLGEMVKAPSSVYPILAAAIAGLPVDYEIFDGYVTRESFRRYKDRLRRPDLVCITVMTPLKALDTELTIKLIRALNPKARIILGGNHASAWPERWIKAGADFVVIREGEFPFRQLIRALLGEAVPLAEIPNLYWRDGATVQHSQSQAPLLDLNQTPLPDWSRFNFQPYGMGMSGGSMAAIEVSRGCPHRCDFCNINQFWNYKQRYKTVDRVIEELQALHRIGVREFIFTDDNFGGDHRHTVALLEAMVRLKLDMRFGCFLRGDTIHKHPEFADLAAAAGMRFCMMGIETLDPAWLLNHRKGVRADDVVTMYANVYGRLKARGIFVVGLFISPPQSERTKFSGTGACGIVCDYHYSANLMAQKGSALYDDYSSHDAVGKDMFYHDWNMSSIVLEPGVLQRNQKSFFEEVRESLSVFGVKSALFGTPFARRFRWRPVWVVLERLLCTTWGDIKRWRLAKDEALSLQERQDRMIATVLSDDFVAALVKRRFWTSPLSLRNGLF